MSKLAKALTASAGNAGGDPVYVEDVFSAFLYDGTNTNPTTITNGIDLAGEGGLVWTKLRNTGETHALVDTARGSGSTWPILKSQTTAAQGDTGGLLSFTSTGYTVSNQTTFNGGASNEYVSWTFRKAEKFFDVVAYSGNDVSGRTIAHNLGSVPGMMIVKQTNGVYNWQIYHTALGNTKFLEFNTGAAQTNINVWQNTTPTDSVFTVGNEYGVNQSGKTYVAYLFASDAGGYGDAGDENIIKCGSFTHSSSTGNDINLGFEPQWLLIKSSTSSIGWYMWDTMRGWSTGAQVNLQASSSSAESAGGNGNAAWPQITNTGFRLGTNNNMGDNQTYVYMAIRRGPMKTPDDATKVFVPGLRSGSGSIAKTNSNILADVTIITRTNSSSEYNLMGSRLQGPNNLYPENQQAEGSGAISGWDTMTGMLVTASNGAVNTGNLVDYSFRRAPGFMDVAAYIGNGVTGTKPHNLAVVPEMIVCKIRNSVDNWQVYHSALGASKAVFLDNTNATQSWAFMNNTAPTASVFTADAGYININTYDFVAYLFATLAGVSKVGSYTGNAGYAVNVPCGFSGNARFIFIKRTDSTGDWYLYNSASGITAGNDPYYVLNTTAAEVTGTDYIDPLSGGFTVTASAPAGLNASSGNYIFLAIA